MKPIKNDYWNGKDASFLRCIDSNTGEYHDVLISRAIDVNLYSDICKMSYLLNPSFGIITGKYINADTYIRLIIEDGKELEMNEENLFFGNVVDSNFLGFYFDADNHRIVRPCEDIYMKGYSDEITYEEGIEQFIADYNNKIGSCGKD